MIKFNFPQEIRVFIGHQFNSEFFSSDNFVKIVKSCCQKAESNLKGQNHTKNFSLKVHSQDFHLEVGEIINNSIHNQIKLSDICIFEISDNNPNVMYESGFAIGLDKTVIYVSHSSRVRNIASDISGVGIATYEKIDSLDVNLVNEVEKGIVKIINSKSVVDSFWKFTNYPTTAYLGKEKSNFSIGDLKALELIRAKLKNHKNIELGIEQSFSDKLSSNLIIIGGPKSNEYVEKTFAICKQDKFKISELKEVKTQNKWCILKNDEIYRCTDFTHEKTTESDDKDYALIYLGRNPYNSTLRWICFSGLSRVSTLESIRCFLDENELSRILEEIDYKPSLDYCIILEIGIHNGRSYGFRLIESEKIMPSDNS